MVENTSRESLEGYALIELREDIAELKDVIAQLNAVVATQSAEIKAMSREIAELRNFRSNAVLYCLLGMAGVAWYLIQKFVLR